MSNVQELAQQSTQMKSAEEEMESGSLYLAIENLKNEPDLVHRLEEANNCEELVSILAMVLNSRGFQVSQDELHGWLGGLSTPDTTSSKPIALSDDMLSDVSAGYSTVVNSQVTDAVTQANVKVIGDGPAMAMGLIYQQLAATMAANGQSGNGLV